MFMIQGKRILDLHLLKNLLYTTVRIRTIDDDGVGTGFFYHFRTEEGTIRTLIVTNRHVVEGVNTGEIVFHLGPNVNDMPTGGTYKVTITDFENQFVFHPDPEIDLCATDVTVLLFDIKKRTSKDVYYEAFTEQNIATDEDLKELLPIEDVYMIGYPNGLWDEFNNLPVARKGVTASDPRFDFNQKSRGAIDIASFQGSSGSPVLLYRLGGLKPDRSVSLGSITFFLLGVLDSLAAFDVTGEMVEVEIPVKKIKVPLIYQPYHIGYYIKAREINNLVDELFKPS